MDHEKTFRDLEWPRLCAAIRDRCVAKGAAEREIPLAESLEAARRGLAESGEALALLTEGDPIPLEGMREVRLGLSRIAREGSLTGPDLRDLRLTLDAAGVLRRFLGRHRERAPALFAACAIDPTLDRLADEIGDAVDLDGTVSDNASADLRRLRREVHDLRARLVSRLEAMIHKNSAILSDTFYTVRDGRYVVPVRTDAHERFPGIVHGTSSSGATIFVEPRGVVGQGNRLKVAEGEMEREEARILAAVSDLVRESLAQVLAGVDALEHADLRHAMARLGRELGGRVIPIVEDARAELIDAKHPLLLLDGVDVVANDIVIEPATALVVSGPNAGGKTVALKVVGLSALMARAGVPIVAAEGSAIGFFDPILTDFGDEQSIEKNLSTFSAHVTNLAAMLERASPSALVLLDELAGGTDPAEGAALACAIVEALVERGTLVAVTTHYEPLKAFALSRAKLRNASVGFDVERMLPTFELLLDVPGASSALSVAERFGIDPAVVSRARSILPEQARDFDELTRELAGARDRFAQEAGAIEAERLALVAARAAVEKKERMLASRDQKALSEEAEKLRAELRSARDEAREVRRRLKRKNIDEATLKTARQEIEAASSRSADARAAAAAAREGHDEVDAARGGVSEDTLVIGSRVFVPRLRAEAEVIEKPKRGKVKVAAGAIRLTVDVSELRAAASAEAEKDDASGRPKAASARRERRPPPAIQTTENTLDVRGLRVDEALSMTETFVDRLYGASAGHAFIIHGHGTGALRDAIRAQLARDEHYVTSIRPGSREEGGDGVTVVALT